MTEHANQQDLNVVSLCASVRAYILACQLPDGAIPWFSGGKLDPWDHVEAAMGLCIGGDYAAARRAFIWLQENQNTDGSWYAKYLADAEDGDLDRYKIETNFVAYPACGLWHYYLVTGDRSFVIECFPMIRKAIDFVISHQRKEGDIQWAISQHENLPKDALITACASIVRSLECAIFLAELVEETHPWETPYLRLAEALKHKPWRFDRSWEPKTRFSMDWFYPLLAGIYTAQEAHSRIDARHHEFVHPQLGCRCVSDEPWITVAESCELSLALNACGRKEEALKIFQSLLRWQDQDGGFWTGYSFRDKVIWPQEKTTWTAAAILLAADALYQISPAHDLFTQPSHLFFAKNP